MKRLLPDARRPVPSRLSLSRRLRCEPLEDRRMLSVLFVNDDAPAGGDGLAWGSACNDLQDALSQAEILNSDGDDGNDVDQIWIAEGVYKPSDELEPGELRSRSFSLLDGVSLIGGFAGTETAIVERDWAAHKTVLSGDVGVVDNSTDNVWTVVYCPVRIVAAIDGVSITGGRADGSSWIHEERSNGGGVFSLGTLEITNSIFSDNVAVWGGGIGNEGILEITNSLFSGNVASDGRGGGIYSNESVLTVTNSTLSGNSAPRFYWGGGGGIATVLTTLTLNNTIVAGNTGYYASDVFHDQSGVLTGSHVLIGDGCGQTLANGSDGNVIGTSEKPIDPLLIRNPSDGGDGWGDDPTTPDINESVNDDYGDLHLQAGSPAVDAGLDGLLPADHLDLDGDGNVTEPIPVDLAGSARVADGDGDMAAYVDMGAYELVAAVTFEGDLNGDGMVGSGDLDIVRGNWSRCVPAGDLSQGDANGDGRVGSADLDIVRANWGSAAPVAAGVLEATGGDGGEKILQRRKAYGPHDVTDVAMCNWDRARLAWAEAIEGLSRGRTRDVKTARRAGVVDLVLVGWERD